MAEEDQAPPWPSPWASPLPPAGQMGMNPYGGLYDPLNPQAFNPNDPLFEYTARFAPQAPQGITPLAGGDPNIMTQPSQCEQQLNANTDELGNVEFAEPMMNDPFFLGFEGSQANIQGALQDLSTGFAPQAGFTGTNPPWVTAPEPGGGLQSQAGFGDIGSGMPVPQVDPMDIGGEGAG